MTEHHSVPDTSSWLSARRVKILTAIAASGIAFVAMYEQWLDIYTIAIRDEESSQVLLVPLVVAWLVWVGRHRLNFWNYAGQWSGPLMVIAGWTLANLGYTKGILVLWHLGAVTVVLGALIGVLGEELLKRFPAALCALLFLIPVPGLLRQSIATPLQQATAATAESVLALGGAPIERSGNLLLINETPILIAEACNGLRMLFALGLVVYAFAFGTNLRLFWRIMFLVATPVVALILNVIRLYPTVWFFGYASEEFAQTFHDVSGWIMMLLAMGLLTLITRSLPSAVAPEKHASPEAEAESNRWDTSRNMFPGIGLQIFTYILLAAVLFDTVVRAVDPKLVAAFHQDARATVEDVPYRIGNWVGVDGSLLQEELEMLQPNAMLRRIYRNLDTQQEMALLIVQCEDARDMVGHYPRVCYSAQGWVERTSRPQDWEVSGRTIHGQEYEFQMGEGEISTTLYVANVLMLPGGSTTGQMADVASSAADYRIRRFGAAQLQLTFGDTISKQEQLATVDEFIRMLSPTISGLSRDPFEDTGKQEIAGREQAESTKAHQ